MTIRSMETNQLNYLHFSGDLDIDVEEDKADLEHRQQRHNRQQQLLRENHFRREGALIVYTSGTTGRPKVGRGGRGGGLTGPNHLAPRYPLSNPFTHQRKLWHHVEPLVYNIIFDV